MNRDKHIQTNANAERECCLCNRKPYQHPFAGNIWTLNGYYGLTGYFCKDCYKLVAHDAYGNPIDPDGYAYAVGALLI